MADVDDPATTSRAELPLVPVGNGGCPSGNDCASSRGSRTWLRQQLRCRQAAVEQASRRPQGDGGATTWPRRGADGVWEAAPGWLPWPATPGSESAVRQAVAAVSPSVVRSVTGTKARTWEVLFGGGRPWRVTLLEWNGDEFPYDQAVPLLADRLAHGSTVVDRAEFVGVVRETFGDA